MLLHLLGPQILYNVIFLSFFLPPSLSLLPNECECVFCSWLISMCATHFLHGNYYYENEKKNRKRGK